MSEGFNGVSQAAERRIWENLEKLTDSLHNIDFHLSRIALNLDILSGVNTDPPKKKPPRFDKPL